MVHCTTGSLEGHGAECTFVENLAVSLLDVAFQQGQSQVDDTTVDAPVAHFSSIVQAILLYMSLEVGRAAEDTTLRAAVGGLVGMNPLVCTETTLVWQQHLAYLASLGKNTKKANDTGGVEWRNVLSPTDQSGHSYLESKNLEG